MIWINRDYTITYDAVSDEVCVELKNYNYEITDNEDGFSADITTTDYVDYNQLLKLLGANNAEVQELLDNEENRIKLCDFVCEEYMLEKGLEERCEL